MNKVTDIRNVIHDYIELSELGSNKLFCTFTAPEELDNTLNTLTTKYTILYSKIFVLESLSTEEYVCTYNIDTFNMEQQSVLPNTILLHRKKESNTLYTINALNALIKSLNGGILDTNYRITWLDYKNSILLVQNNDLNIIKTKIHRIINL
jgi:hypothetical protein